MKIYTTVTSPYITALMQAFANHDLSDLCVEEAVSPMYTLIQGNPYGYTDAGANQLRQICHILNVIQAVARTIRLVFIPGKVVSIPVSPFVDWVVLLAGDFDETASIIKFCHEVTRIANISEDDRLKSYPYVPNQYRKTYRPLVSLAVVKAGTGVGYAKSFNENPDQFKCLKSAVPINDLKVRFEGCIFDCNLTQP